MITKQTVSSFRSLKTPFYYYDMDILARTLSDLKAAADRQGYRIHYALKANANIRILQRIRECGFGADCVSGNEVRRAREAGFPPDRIVFAGVGKADWEIRLALKHGISCFNCESLQEMEVIDQLAGESGTTANIAFRVNPDVDAKTHEYITTGLEENKFGINAGDLGQALDLVGRMKRLTLVGLHFHIGSQITDPTVFQHLCVRVNEIQSWLRDRNVRLERINLGGGLGVDYHHPDEHAVPDFASYFALFKDTLEPLPGQEIHFEPGRAVVAQCGSLITRVLYVKSGLKTRFVILDAGMTELIRPALYQSYHRIENLTSDGPPEPYDVVGPICESSDCFGKAVTLPSTRRGDIIALRTTGAYGETMASGYNMRDRAPAVYSDEL